jgi:aminocarboxymuconate-semialdehyde decarboxylase
MVVDVHAHLYPRAFMEALAAAGPAHGVSLTADAPPFLCFEGIRFWRYTDGFHDVDARLRQLDAAGVDTQVLSLGPPMVYWAPPELGLRLARIHNDEIAKVAHAHPDRFVGFAAVPLQDPSRTLAELDRAVDLGLRGVGIGSNVHGVPLDAPALWPFYARVEALDLPLFIHPINPPGQPRIHDYRLDLVVGFPMDTTLAATRLVYGGTLERFPRLRICLAHLGGALPFLRERIALGYRVGREHFGADIAIAQSPETYLERFWLDSVSYYEPAMAAGVACVGVERIVMGSDAPFAIGDLRRSVESIRALSFLPVRDRERILGANAVAYLTGGAGA